MISSFKNILIVEDEFLALEYLKDILSKLGFNNTFNAKNAEDAINLVKEANIDLIFMDINIKGKIDGINCAKHINEIYNIPIIYTTAYVDDETMKEANSTNIYGYIMKPFNLKDVQSILNIAASFIDKQKYQIKKHEEILKKATSKEVIILAKNYSYYKHTKTMKHFNNTVNLTKREIEIIDLLCSNLNQTVSYNLLNAKIWNNKNIASSTIRDAVSRLKKKLVNLDIQNITNVGYQLNN